MPFIDCLIAMQQGEVGNSSASEFILVALVVLVLGFVVYVFIRTSAKRSSNRR